MGNGGGGGEGRSVTTNFQLLMLNPNLLSVQVCITDSFPLKTNKHYPSISDQYDRETDTPNEQEDIDWLKVCDEVIPRSADMLTGYATTAGRDTHTRETHTYL